MKSVGAMLVLLSVFCIVLAEDDTECGTCDQSACSEPVNCVAGTVDDECNCCKECALAEGELCDLHPETNSEYGTCGESLECRATNKAEDEAICFCLYTEPLCATDGKTYRSMCHLREAKVLDKNGDLKVVAKGPCKSAPKILSGPEHQKNHTGANVAISCEAEGYPIPAIDWIFTRANGKAVQLPEDDRKVSVNIRGGPGNYQVTGWIQIMTMEKRHEGDYTCVATNKHGTDKAPPARLIVLDEQDGRDRDL